MDIKYKNDGDIDLTLGDTRLVEPSEQHKLTVIVSRKGELKNRPDVGVDVAEYLLDNDPGTLLREARRHCQKIGMKIQAVFFDSGKLKVIGGYENS